MKKLIVVLVLMLVALATAPVFASSIFGMKGLLFVPTGDTQAQGKFTVSFQMVGVKNFISFDYSPWENFEVYINMTNSSSFTNSGLHGGMKYRILQEMEIQPALAIGLMNTDLYVVASKTLETRSNVRGHIGFGNNGGAFEGLFFGFNKVYNPVSVRNNRDRSLIPVTNFKLEFLKDNVNLGADIHLNEYFTGNIGIVNFREFNYGFSYTSEF